MPHNGEAINVTKRETTNASQEGGDKMAHSWGDDLKMLHNGEAINVSQRRRRQQGGDKMGDKRVEREPDGAP